MLVVLGLVVMPYSPMGRATNRLRCFLMLLTLSTATGRRKNRAEGLVTLEELLCLSLLIQVRLSTTLKALLYESTLQTTVTLTITITH